MAILSDYLIIARPNFRLGNSAALQSPTAGKGGSSEPTPHSGFGNTFAPFPFPNEILEQGDPAPSITFGFFFPPGTVLGPQLPILHYKMTRSSASGSQRMGLVVLINDVEIHRRMFKEGNEDVFVEEIVGFPTTAAPFRATGPNTIRFISVDTASNPTHEISFSSVLLWFQRDSAAAG